MPQTSNHGYNVPEEGVRDWHKPLNANFRQYETDIEIRDTLDNMENYEPKPGAKFFASDVGIVSIGDGSNWTPVATTGPEPTLTGINTGRNHNLGIGTATPSTPLDIRGQNNWNLDNADGDIRVGDDQHRLAIGVALGGAGAGTVNVRAKGGSNRLNLGAGSENGIITIDESGVQMTADSGEDGSAVRVENVSNERQAGAITGVTQGPRGIGVKGIAKGEKGAGVFAVGGENSPALTTGGSAIINGPLQVTDDSQFTGNSEIFGDVSVTGDLEVNGTKNFIQPVDTGGVEQEVVYTSTEAPTPRTEASGVAEIEDDRAEIDLPEHFAWVTSDEEPLMVQVTPHASEPVRPQVTERSTDRIVIEDFEDGADDYEVSYTVKGTRDGYADKEVVRGPASQATQATPSASADD